ncbi:MAG: DNA double-strand break repair nuclease NurA [SAR202 cluster bacterium]|nr:DNA double-strand break repair nuclease NurA [SAR202 cluster bacterium]|tara:strand:+ start:3048 stop:4247 length:1200 start_codon:yes stop_codon:yes gene_type:complete
MALNINKTAIQINEFANEFQKNYSEHFNRVRRAQKACEEVLVKRKNTDQADDFGYKIDYIGINDTNEYTVPLRKPLNEYRVISTDGSHIGIDRDLPTKCFLINIGIADFLYGDEANAELINIPRLYAKEEDLIIREKDGMGFHPIEDSLLNAKRSVEEILALAKVLGETDFKVPTLGLVDGPLAVYGLPGVSNKQYVIDHLVRDGFESALASIKSKVNNDLLGVIGFTSLPGNRDVSKMLSANICENRSDKSGFYCHYRGSNIMSICSNCIGGVLDREIFAGILKKGERSPIFLPKKNDNQINEIAFFYLNVGSEIARIEIPMWNIKEAESIDLIQSVLMEQTERGHGYPVVLMEAHEQAVINSADRRAFADTIVEYLSGDGSRPYESAKALSKKIRGI